MSGNSQAILKALIEELGIYTTTRTKHVSPSGHVLYDEDAALVLSHKNQTTDPADDLSNLICQSLGSPEESRPIVEAENKNRSLIPPSALLKMTTNFLNINKNNKDYVDLLKSVSANDHHLEVRN